MYVQHLDHWKTTDEFASVLDLQEAEITLHDLRSH
jgi:hypothetical protein